MTADGGDVVLTFRAAAPPEEVWSVVRRFDEVATWNPFFASSRLVSGTAGGVGAIREIVTAGGVTVREQLDELDDAVRLVGYRMLTFPIPVTEQRNRIAVAPGHAGQASLVTFSAHFVADGEARVAEVADTNRSAFAAAANGIGRALGVEVVPRAASDR